MGQAWKHPSDNDTGYMNVFVDGYYLKEPLVLEDGTSVLFPMDWTDEDADKWRMGARLQRPKDCPTKICGRLH
jgi:hypothetical protein